MRSHNSPESNDEPDRRRFRSPEEPTESRWPLGDIFLMIVAAVRVMIPYLLVILAAVGGAWALWALVFRS